MSKNFALFGAAGYIAPRHMKAIKDTGNKLSVIVDPNDSVGVIDRYFPGASYFRDVERADRHIDKLRRRNNGDKIDYFSICSPNHLHDAHIRLALRNDANAICEKPLVLKPSNLDGLAEFENESGKKVYTVLQLREHPSIKSLREQMSSDYSDKRKVELTYITPRGLWYDYSWKGDMEKSGGVATNIGIHFFDMLHWIFGNVSENNVHYHDESRASGSLSLEKADVNWFLSVDRNDLPKRNTANGQNKAYRSITIDGKEIEFSNVFSDLHVDVYKGILEGRGWGIEDARPSIEIAYDIRKQKPSFSNVDVLHPRLEKLVSMYGINEDGFLGN